MQGFDAGCDSTRVEFESLQIQSTATNEGKLSQRGSRRSVARACEVASLHLSTRLPKSAQSTSSLFKPLGHQMSFICCPSLLTGTAPHRKGWPEKPTGALERIVENEAQASERISLDSDFHDMSSSVAFFSTKIYFDLHIKY